MTALKALIARVIAWVLSLKIVRAFLRYSEHNGPKLADGVTYRALFSVFAGVLLGFSIAAIWLSDNPEAWDALVGAVSGVIPGLVGEGGIIDTTEIDAPTGFTVAGALAAAGLIGAAIGVITSLRVAIRTIADKVTDDLMFVWVMLRNLLIAAIAGGLLVGSAVATFLGSQGVTLVATWLGRPESGPIAQILTRLVSIAVVFAVNAVVVAALYRLLSGDKPSARSLWSGAVLGGVGLIVLQQLSSLFVAGATRNPLLATFASLIALLIWFNLSSQVILIACAYISIGVEEEADRVRARQAQTFAQRRLKRAEDAVMVATDELRAAQTAVAEEREKAAEERAKTETQDA